MEDEKLEERVIRLARMNPETVSREICNFIIEHVQAANASGAVIGLSGGVDSTTTAALAKRAFDAYNQKKPKCKLELVGYILPSATNSPDDESDGVKVAERLGIRYEVLTIEPIVEAFGHTNPEAFKKSYDKGNLMSRIRANILSTKAATERKTLIGTGNKDEDFGIGYYTMFGDGAVHMSPIGALPKRLVRQMAIYQGFPDLANRVPTAGLEKGQTDAGDLGYDYDAVEIVLEGLGQGFTQEQLAGHSQVKNIVEPQFAHNRKFSRVADVVDDILQRHYLSALPKAEIIHPPIPEVTLDYR
jgi:NAD+ synthase